MSFTYTTRNGQRVETAVAAAFDRLAAEFKRVFGLELIVSSGTRTRDEQAYLYNGWIRKLPGFNLAAPPGQSNHEESGPRGPRALDVRDSGGDAGVTVRGSARANWLRANAPRFGFDPAGYGFSQVEPWHIEYTGSLGAGGGGGNSSYPAQVLYGADWVKVIQGKLNRLGYNLVIDGEDGTATQGAVRDFQSKNGLAVDGVAGPDTNNKLDSILNANGPLDVDGQMGAATTRRLQERLGVTADGQMGPQTVKALQGRLHVAADGEIGTETTSALQRVIGANVDGSWGTETTKALQRYLNAGGNFNVAPPTQGAERLVEDGELGPATIKRLQERLKVTADGELGPETTKALQSAIGSKADGELGPDTITRLQKNVGATADGKWGPETTKALQRFLNDGRSFVIIEDAPVTPPAPGPAPKTDPVYPGASEAFVSPYSDGLRSKKGDQTVEEVINLFIIHHTGVSNDNLDYFLRRNDRDVAPSWYVRNSGKVVETVRPGRKPATTGPEYNYRSLAVECQNTTGAPEYGISNETREAIAQLIAWVATFDGKTLDGVRVDFKIDADHIKGHGQLLATTCPGPNMDVPWIIKRAKEIYEGGQPTPPAPKDVTRSYTASESFWAEFDKVFGK